MFYVVSSRCCIVMFWKTPDKDGKFTWPVDSIEISGDMSSWEPMQCGFVTEEEAERAMAIAQKEDVKACFGIVKLDFLRNSDNPFMG